MEQIKEQTYHRNKNEIIKFFNKYIPSAYLKDETLREYQFILPLIERCNPLFWKLFNALEKEREHLKIKSYGIHDVSLEEIFIKAAELPEKTNTSKRKANVETSPSKLPSTSFISTQKEYSKSLYDLDYMYEHLETGYRLHLKQIYATVIKRCLYNKRNWKSLLTQIILPAGFICVAMTVALSAPGFIDLPPLELNTAQYYPATKTDAIHIPFNYDNTARVNECTGGHREAASSIEIVETLRFIVGVGSTCTLNTPNLTTSDILNKNRPFFNEKFFGNSGSCHRVFNQKADIDLKYFEKNLALNNSLFFRGPKSNKKYFPNCICLKDLSGFECEARETYSAPPEFLTTTHETLLNISGTVNENDYYLYTTDSYRLKRYGGLSFDNEIKEFRNECINKGKLN